MHMPLGYGSQNETQPQKMQSFAVYGPYRREVENM